MLTTGKYLIQHHFSGFRIALVLGVKSSKTKKSISPMRNKFLTDIFCSAIKSLPEDYVSNIIGKHASWKLICKYDLICRISTDNMVLHNFINKSNSYL